MAKRKLGPTTTLYPMPALLIAVKTGEDSANMLTVAWAGIVGGSPPTMAVEIGRAHYSTPHLEREGCFTANVPRSDQVVAVDYCGLVSGHHDADKTGTCGFTLQPASKVSAPLIAECPLNLECRIIRTIEAPGTAFYLAEIVETHIDEGLLADDGTIDALALDPLVFGPDGHYYALGRRVAKAWDAGKALAR